MCRWPTLPHIIMHPLTTIDACHFITLCFTPLTPHRLTAFVVKSFMEAKQYVTVDMTRVEASLDYMLSPEVFNEREGYFTENGRVIHNELQVPRHTHTHITPHWRIQGGWASLAPKIFSKSCSFQAISREKPYFEQILGSGPLGSKLCWAPLTKQTPGSALHPMMHVVVRLFWFCVCFLFTYMQMMPPPM